MRHKLTLTLILALITLILPVAFVRHSAARTGIAVNVDCISLTYGAVEPVRFDRSPPFL